MCSRCLLLSLSVMALVVSAQSPPASGKAGWTVNGGTITLPAGTQSITSPIAIGSEPGAAGDITVSGQGAATVLQRGADLPSGQGLINIYGSNIVLKDFVIDGAVETPAGVPRSALGDPMDDLLSRNTSIWIHPGARRVRLENITIRHTGGYAVLLDARDGDITRVEIVRCRFENNRPHLFGPEGDLHYGAWTGGILFKNDGVASTTAVHGLTVRGCSFRRIAGAGVWGHSNGFAAQHTDVKILGNTFRDMGGDGIEPGNVTGGLVQDNTLYRIGYITTDDDGEGVPKWAFNNPPAVAIDSTGFVKGVNYVGNTIVNFNGGGIDGDGFHEGLIAANTLWISPASDPYYRIDNVAAYGPAGKGNSSYGIQPGNTYYGPGGSEIIISNNSIKGVGLWGVSGCNLKNCVISGNTITQAPGAIVNPIILYNKPGWDNGVLMDGDNEGADALHRSHGNLIAGNRIDCNPAAFAIAELNSVNETVHKFKATDVNRAFHNRIGGNCTGEFQPSPDSGSSAAPALPPGDDASR